MTHLAEKSRCTILLSQIAGLLDGSNTAAHRFNALKSDNLVRFLRMLFKFRLQIQEIIILGNDTFSTRVTHTLDHGSMENKIQEGSLASRVGRVAHCIVSSTTQLLSMPR